MSCVGESCWKEAEARAFLLAYVRDDWMILVHCKFMGERRREEREEYM